MPLSEQRLAVGGGNTRAPARRPGACTGLERGLDGGDELRSLRVNDNVPEEQHAADGLPGAGGRASCGPMVAPVFLSLQELVAPLSPSPRASR